MPTFNSEIYANQIGGMVRNRVDSLVMCGEKRYAELEYKFLGTEASGDTIKFGQLPPNVAIYADDIKLISEGIGGTTVTLTTLGDQQTTNRYSTTAIPLTAAANGAAVTPVVATTVPLVTITAGTNDVVQGVLGGTLPATAGKRVWLRIAYRMNS
jgi:hypothetical protein